MTRGGSTPSLSAKGKKMKSFNQFKETSHYPSMYLDDLRNPKDNSKNWIVLRSSREAIDYVKKNGMLKFASFDHDLGGDDTTMVFLKWLIEYDLDHDRKIIPRDFKWNIHSANPVGSSNINSLLSSYLKN